MTLVVTKKLLFEIVADFPILNIETNTVLTQLFKPPDQLFPIHFALFVASSARV